MPILPRSASSTPCHAEKILPGGFCGTDHFYERVLNAPIHPLVASFLSLSNEHVVERYARLCPGVSAAALGRLFAYVPDCFHWAGADLLHATDLEGRRRMLLLETNSCPSGQKSMPLLNENEGRGGYEELLKKTFCRLLVEKPLPDGVLAVIHDKNPMENSGYAKVLADLTGEAVYCAKWLEGDPDPCVRVADGFMVEIRDETGAWRPVRAALRYLTQAPWRRLPAATRTLLFNPVAACLSGGRNKSLADRAYADFNAEHENVGLKISIPRTWRNVPLAQIPWHVRRLGGRAVIKNPYSNAGQGVWTVVGPEELRHFLALSHDHDKFLVQELVGDAAWEKDPPGAGGARLFHVGTVPGAHRETCAFDLRFMIASQKAGFRPVALYARRARSPLSVGTAPPRTSWEALGTNLSVKTPSGWLTETERLLLMDWKDFASLGLGLNELIEAFVQSVLATVAIDRMAKLFMTDGNFNATAFAALNEDAHFDGEILK